MLAPFGREALRRPLSVLALDATVHAASAERAADHCRGARVSNVPPTRLVEVRGVLGRTARTTRFSSLIPARRRRARRRRRRNPGTASHEPGEPHERDAPFGREAIRRPLSAVRADARRHGPCRLRGASRCSLPRRVRVERAVHAPGRGPRGPRTDRSNHTVQFPGPPAYGGLVAGGGETLVPRRTSPANPTSATPPGTASHEPGEAQERDEPHERDAPAGRASQARPKSAARAWTRRRASAMKGRLGRLAMTPRWSRGVARSLRKRTRRAGGLRSKSR